MGNPDRKAEEILKPLSQLSITSPFDEGGNRDLPVEELVRQADEIGRCLDGVIDGDVSSISRKVAARIDRCVFSAATLLEAVAGHGGQEEQLLSKATELRDKLEKLTDKRIENLFPSAKGGEPGAEE